MQRSPNEFSQKENSKKTASKSTKNLRQHGFLDEHLPALPGDRLSILLEIPAESLTHVTSFLDPSSLLVLGRVCKLLCQHVKDDDTWHRAFARQFHGVDPESDAPKSHRLMFKRLESTWKKEFIARYKLICHWESSRNVILTHTPHHAPISSMMMMPAHGLLSSSLQYGIVSRSIPLSGKVLRGYLDASGTGPGNGNPNTEFTPNVSGCALSSEGGTAKIVWGFRTGQVAIMVAGKAMHPDRVSTRFTRCSVEDEHRGMVTSVLWDYGDNGVSIVTGAIDGRVKIWDPTHLQLRWTSDQNPASLVPDPCLMLVSALSKGLIVGAMKSGEIVLWSGFGAFVKNSSSVFEVRIPAPVPSQDGVPLVISALHLDAASRLPAILVRYDQHPHFYRLRVDLSTRTVDTALFGDPSFAAITSLKPLFNDRGSGFVVVGDQLGCISVYDWSISTPAVKTGDTTSQGQNFIRASVRIDETSTDNDAAVTALAWNGVVLLAGSARGSIHVFDAVSLTHLRTFTVSAPRQRSRTLGFAGGAGDDEVMDENKVTEILIGPEMEVMFASVGGRVAAWGSGPVRKSDPKSTWRTGTVSGKKKQHRTPVSQYQQKLEMKEGIIESRETANEDRRYTQHVRGREREQMAGLQDLGLDEIEAVEYLLMVSRDEEERRVSAKSQEESGSLDQTPETLSLISPTQTARFAFPPPLSPSPSNSSANSESHASQFQPQLSPSSSLGKVQVSPRFRPEPVEAGPSSFELSGSSWEDDSRRRSQPRTASQPSISTWPAPPSASASPSSRTKTNPASAWARPLRITPSGNVGGYSRDSAPPASTSAPYVGLTGVARNAGSTESHGNLQFGRSSEDDLRYALEMSLAEARSRGEDV